MRKSPYIILFLILCSCSIDQLEAEGTLDAFTDDVEIVIDNVIACAASNEKDDLISVFLYPREGATNVQYFETENIDVDKNDFKAYRPRVLPLKDVFNGYLKKFEVSVAEERWVIVAFDKDGKRHLSNPIRLKQKTKPTEYLPQNIEVDASLPMPNFSWRDGIYDDTKIYFQVVADTDNNLISGTYTFDKNFQFYNLTNVVLNITPANPPALQSDTVYSFTLLAVSEDNWVNQFSEAQFRIE